MKRSLLSLLCLLCSLTACVGPQSVPPSSIKPIDQSVVATVQMNLKTDPELAASGITVAAENDLLVLRGTVPSEAAKARAESIAKKTPRITKIANHLEVTGEEVAPAP
jgi:predicted small lipoprotein YifL